MNYFLTASNSQKRIIEDWINFDRLLVAVDFDSTLKPWKDFEGDHCDDVCQLIRELKEIGCFIILFTANKHPDKCLEWCEAKNIPIDTVNENAPEAMEYFLRQGYDEPPRKLFWNVLIDDKSGLQQTYNELKTLIHLVQSGIINKKHELV